MIKWIKSWFKDPKPTEFDVLEKEIKEDLDKVTKFEDLEIILFKLSVLVHHTRTYGEADRLKSLNLSFELKQNQIVRELAKDKE